MKLRQETPADAGAIRAVTEAAFAGAAHSSGSEGAIVDALRDEGTLALSLVADDGGRIVGHVAFSPVVIGRPAGGGAGWLGLGPVSVSPERQGQGIGGALIAEGLARLVARGARGCVVLGEPAYYRRFGFAPDAALRFEGAPPEYFLCRSFAGEVPAGAVAYRPAFSAG